MSGFASSTSVPVERSKIELDRLLAKHGATQRGTAHDDEAGFAVVFFALSSRQIRLQIPLPKVEEFAKRPDPYWAGHFKAVTNDQKFKNWEQACRTRWRCMLLIVKAKLELIEMKLSTVDREFLADITLPDGRSVGEWLKPGIEQAYMGGKMPPMLGMGSGPVEGELEP